MNSTPEFEKFARRFIQDLDLICQTDKEALNFVLKDLNASERVRLAGFLKEITSDRVSNSELQRIWNGTETDITFHQTADLRKMLERVASQLSPD